VVALAPQITPHVRVALKAGRFAFSAVGALGAAWEITCRRTDLEMRSSAGTARTARWACVRCECGAPGELLLSLDASSRFPLVPSIMDDARAEALIGAAHVRDFVVAVIRAFGLAAA
jgi:hypothetical protein